MALCRNYPQSTTADGAMITKAYWMAFYQDLFSMEVMGEGSQGWQRSVKKVIRIRMTGQDWSLNGCPSLQVNPLPALPGKGEGEPQLFLSLCFLIIMGDELSGASWSSVQKGVLQSLKTKAGWDYRTNHLSFVTRYFMNGGFSTKLGNETLQRISIFAFFEVCLPRDFSSSNNLHLSVSQVWDE